MKNLLKRPEVIAAIITSIFGGLFLLIGNYQQDVLTDTEQQQTGNNEISITGHSSGPVIQGDNNVVYGNSNPTAIKTKDIFGKWRAHEVWIPNIISQFFGQMKIKSEIDFQSNGVFLAKSNLTLADVDYLHADYTGTWSIEGKNILFKITKVDTFINKLGNQGLQAYNGVKIMQQYLNHEEGFKTEEVESFSNKLLKTAWVKNSVEIKKEYIRME